MLRAPYARHPHTNRRIVIDIYYTHYDRSLPHTLQVLRRSGISQSRDAHMATLRAPCPWLDYRGSWLFHTYLLHTHAFLDTTTICTFSISRCSHGNVSHDLPATRLQEFVTPPHGPRRAVRVGWASWGGVRGGGGKRLCYWAGFR